MANSIIFTEKLLNYTCVIWQGQAIFMRYSQLINFLKTNLSTEAANLFAQPHIPDSALKGYTKAKWSSAVFTKASKPLTSLPENEQQEALNLFREKTDEINRFAQKLIETNNVDKQNWGEFIRLAIQIPDYNHILVENKKIVLVSWGFTSKKEENFDYTITKKLKNQTPENKPQNQEKEKPQKQEEELKKEPEIQNTPPQKEKKEPEEIQDPKTEDKQEETTEPQNQKKEEPQKQEEEKKEPEINEPLKEEKNQNEKPPPPPPPPPPPENNGGPWDKFKKKWWLFLILIILLIVIICLICCRKNKTELPDEPNVIIPIDTTKIEKDEDSVRVIISDRLNVALRGKNTDMKLFAKRFKEEYPDDSYKIIYYDTLTYRLQIQIPADKRINVKENLEKKLPEFKLFIWHESMFEHNYVPNDPDFSNPQKAWWHKKVKVFNAWNKSRGDPNIVVAIIDNGFDLNHPEFAGKIYKPWNIVSRSNNVNTGANMDHGTHVAGISIGLADNAKGLAGIAPNCKFMPIQVGNYQGLMSTTAVIDGVLYAIHNGANVVNMSLGMTVDPRIATLPPHEQQAFINYLFKDEEQFWNELFEMAYEKNIIFVLAAGNQDVMIGLDPMQRSNKTIKVSAIDVNEKKASFSNFGNKSTISAPGVDIFSSMPANRFDYMSGTSMAAPLVTGGIALIKSVNPALSYDEIIDLIQSTGIPVNSNKYVGNIIQLDKALNIADNNRKQQPVVNCPEMQRKIDSLLQEIEKIRNQCPDTAQVGTDTLEIPEEPEDYNFAQGRWKSTTYIYNNSGKKITLYFDFFADGTGQITLVEPDNTQCTAKLKLDLRSGKFIIDQTSTSVCNPPPMEYYPYYFECEPDSTGKAQCWAQNKNDNANKFKFRLIKISK